MNATGLMTTPLPMAPDMLSTSDLSILQMGWPVVYQSGGIMRSDLTSMINDSSNTLRQLSCVHPLYDGYCEDSATVSPAALLRPRLGTVLVQQPQCIGKFGEPFTTSNKVLNYHTLYYTGNSIDSKDSIKDSGCIFPIESDVNNSEIGEARRPLDDSAPLPNAAFDEATNPAFRIAFTREVRAGQLLRQGSMASATDSIVKVGGTMPSHSSYLGTDPTAAPVLNVEGVDLTINHSSKSDAGQLLPTGFYYGDPGFPKLGAVAPLSAPDHTGHSTTELLTPSPTSDSVVSILDNSVMQHSGSNISISSLNGAGFQAVGSHYSSTNIFPYPTALALTPQIPAYYCPGIITGQPIQYAVTTLSHSVQLQSSLAQSSTRALSPQDLQTSQPQSYATRRKTRRVAPPSRGTQSPQAPFYWTREQAELFDQVHHRIGVDRATDKAIWDELRHHIPNLTQRRVQSRLQKRRLAIRKYYKLNPKSQLKRHHVHPEFQNNKELYLTE